MVAHTSANIGLGSVTVSTATCGDPGGVTQSDVSSVFERGDRVDVTGLARHASPGEGLPPTAYEHFTTSIARERAQANATQS